MIPCHISIHSNIVQALDLLANPKALVVRLMRCVQHPEDASQWMPSASPKGKQRSDSFNGPVSEDRIEVERAVWWFNPEAEGETEHGLHVRCLEGEIHLEKELQPSCNFSLFKVLVSEVPFRELWSELELSPWFLFLFIFDFSTRSISSRLNVQYSDLPIQRSL